MKNHRVLLLAAEPGISLQVLFCLEALGLETHVLGGPRARHLRWARACTTLAELPDETLADSEYAQRIDAHARTLGIDIIVPSGMPTTRKLVDIKPHLATPTSPLPDRQLLRLFDDKFTFTECAENLGISVPKTIFLGAPEQICLRLLEREIPYPVVIKPTNEGNSNGVVLCRDRAELIARVVSNRDYPYRTLIAQEFIPGLDIDLSVVARDGEVLAAAVQRRVGREIHFIAADDFIEMGRRLASAARFSGPAHFDARYDSRDGTIKLVECNPRFWASITASLWCGVNFVGIALAAALGEPLPAITTVAPQVYMPPTPLAAGLLATPWKRPLWSRTGLAGLRQMLGNLLPYASEEWTARSRRLVERRRTGGDPFAAAGLRF